ncbi:MAG: hypothetical protein GX974_02850 [Clostridiales bacterium]|nr:hypothetical protein [Clostridiales bacterium]
MGLKLAVDGGGTKLSMVLFDDELRLISKGLSGGVNVNQTSYEDSRANVVDCLRQVFGKEGNRQIDRLYVVFVGPVKILYEELEKYATVAEVKPLREAKAGLLAGFMRDEGILALSGTGSDVFYVRKDKRLNSVVGAWGPILGDQGSGTWIGQKAIRKVVAGIEGWREPTLMYELIKRDWQIDRGYEMVKKVHESVAPFRKVASLTRIVGEAARAGDRVALSILREAGELMAIQTDCIIKRENIPIEYQRVVCCGGAWKTHPLMYETFSKMLREMYPNITVEKPWFEHVLAGAVYEILKQDISIDKAREKLSRHFPEYIIDW